MRVCPTCQSTYPDDAEFCLKDLTPLPPPYGATEAALASSLSRRYRIVKKLGFGGMGSVFLAEQITLGNRRVALKVLNRKWLDDPDFLSRFHNEAISTARIQHPNVVTIYESGQADDGSPYIAMEYLEGEPLSEALKNRGALPVGECAEILQQAARGLNAAHKLGIIHRDLKPDNLFLTRGDEGELIVKVVDFGIAKLRESAHTMTGMVLGTPAYMSFEQASGMRSEELDARSDIYSLGVVVYKMVTGRVPFTSDTPVGYLRKHLMEPPPPFRAVAPGLSVPAQVEAVVMKALAKDRDERYGSVLDFAREFARAATPPPVEPPKPLATTRTVEPPVPAVGARRRLAPTEPAPANGPEGGFAQPAPGPPVPPAAPTAPAPDVGARRRLARTAAGPGPRPEVESGAERRSALQPQHEDVPQVGARRLLAPTGAAPTPSPKKPSHAAITGVIAAVALVIVAALVWVYWPKTAQPPKSSQEETRVPTNVQTVVPAPSVNNPPTSPPGPQANPAQIVVQTSPNAQVYLDDTFRGQVGHKGRLVIDDPKPGDHALRVSLAGKKDYEQRVTVAAGQVATITATLADAEKPAPPAKIEAPRPAVAPLVAGTVRENPKDGLKYVWIPPGTFMMGCSSGDSECLDYEKPAHRVTISRGFWIGQTPVTVGAYKRFVQASGRSMPPEPDLSGRPLNPAWGNEAMPIVNVSWDEAQAYCGWAGGRLPSEAEWEHAARAGSSGARYGALDEVAWYADNSGRERLDSAAIWNREPLNYDQRLKDNGNGFHEVRQKRPSRFGLYDMLGNAWQWVNDWYDDKYYQNSPAQDPPGPASGQTRVLRGGAWNGEPSEVRVSDRNWSVPAERFFNPGFRCRGEVANP
jgi:serine/threonine-protein kinase